MKEVFAFPMRNMKFCHVGEVKYSSEGILNPDFKRLLLSEFSNCNLNLKIGWCKRVWYIYIYIYITRQHIQPSHMVKIIYNM